MQQDQDTRYKIRTGVLLQKLDDEMVLLEPETGNYFTLNAVGVFMLQQLDEGLDCSEIVRRTLAVYAATHERVQTDLHNLIADLQQHGLLSPRS